MYFEPVRRIASGTKFLMIAFSIGFWALSFIPILNIFTNIAGWIIFYYWFKLCSASLTNNKGKNIASLILGFIPIFGTLLSLFPVVIYLNIRTVEKEDARDTEVLRKKAEDMRRQQLEDLYERFGQEAVDAENEEAEPELTEEELANQERMARILAEEGESAVNNNDVTGRIGPKVSQSYDQSLLEDALDALNNKESKSDTDFARLTRAAVIMRTGQLTPADRNDPVLMAAYNKHQAGIREFNPNTQQGYRFNTTNYQ